MTTFRSRRVAASEVRLVGASSNDPDAIGIEAGGPPGPMFDIYKEESGRLSICFGSTSPGATGIEMELGEFHALVGECVRRIDAWESELRSEGGAWAEALAR